MARPIKNNAEYFSHDCNMRNDIKIKALRRKFGHTGYAVWCFILETLTDSDFFQIDFSSVNRELLAADYDISPELLTDIVNYCVLIGLLQKTEDNLLYSKTHQRGFSALLYNRERKRMNMAGTNGNIQCNDNVMARRNHAETTEKESYGGSKPIVKYSIEKNSIQEKETTKKKPSLFHRPSVEEVQAYITEKGYELNAAYIWDYYESNGWKVGKNPMRDWKAAVRGWANRETEYQKQQQYGRDKTNWMSDSELAKAKRDAEFNKYIAGKLSRSGDVQGDVQDW